jgi:DNA repair photolyase
MPTKIDWCDDVWNPVWGCSFGCPFCYARKFEKNGIKVFWKDNLKGLGIENFPKERPKKEG